MRTLAVLLWKDLRRALRNPLGWLILLAVPMVITALIGLSFGGSSQTGGLGRIRFALVDEDAGPARGPDQLRGRGHERPGGPRPNPR